jgi:L-fuconolactonase
MRIDAHHHVWELSKYAQTWMTSEESALIGRDFHIVDWGSEAEPLGITRSILVQTVAVRQETLDFLSLAGVTPSIAGVVGWIDADADDIEAQVEALQAHPFSSRLVGLRDLTLYRPEPDWATSASADRFFQLCGRRGLTVDLLLRPDQVVAAAAAAQSNPTVRFVLNHLGNPDFDSTTPELWERAIRPFAAAPNTAIKLSGIATFSRTPGRVEDQLPEYLDKAVACFGASRVMFGSDWPVSRTRMSYRHMASLAERALSTLSSDESRMIWFETATEWYRLEGP